MAHTRYVTVNTYRSSDGWRCAVLIRQSGSPYPRLLRKLVDEPLFPRPVNLPGALRAAAARLDALADEMERGSRA